MLGCWCKVATNSDDFWSLYKPGVDWLEDDMNLSVDGVVKITFNKSLCGKDTSKIFETTYEDFVANYDKTVNRL